MGTENACICQYEKLLLDVYWEYSGVPLHGATVRPYGVLCSHKLLARCKMESHSFVQKITMSAELTIFSTMIAR